jgi:hypothetical protein
LDQPKNHLLDELALQRVTNGPCHITQTSSKESKHHFYREFVIIIYYITLYSVIKNSNKKNLEYFILKKEWIYQFLRHCYDGGRLQDETYPGIYFNKFLLNLIIF